ncbi:EndoU domain-containing protein [Lysinibacillus sp. FJAT-14745]|uniref:EndoU domain-containing protein n=1 Tax=Lysinibacillus sp. FJAT-14745 TaxID=1704289 RepID=UPI000AB0F152|nr:EndoU domain-containing protein [Lysinibacillus sp. FJAT-14745]
MKGFLGAIGNFFGSIPVVKSVVKIGKNVVKIGKNVLKGIKKAGNYMMNFFIKFTKKIGKFYTMARKKASKLKKWAIRLGKRTLKAGVLWLKNTAQKGKRWIVQKSKQVYQKAKQVYDKGVNVVKTAAKEAVKAYKSIDTMAPLKITEEMSAKEKLLRGVFNTTLINTQIKKGEFDATVDILKDAWGEVKEILADPPKYVSDSIIATSEGIANLAFHPVQTTTAIKDSVKDSFEKDVINGNAYSRSYWKTNKTLSIAKEFVGKKGTGLLKGIPMPNPIPMRMPMPMPNFNNGILPDSKQPNPSKDPKKPEETKGTGNNSKPVSGDNSIITPEMKEKILLGQRKNPNKNEIIGGHSSNINNSHSNYATEVIKINPDGTKDIKYITQFPDGNLSKIKNSTTFPEGWSDIKILDSITDIGNSPSISIRGRDGATLHRGIVDGVEIDVIKIGDTVVSGYPTGQINAPLPGGFSN